MNINMIVNNEIRYRLELGLDIQAMSNRVISSNPQSLATSKDKF